ncbi:MAG: outer membrane lipoprotein carrier protein LolA [Thermodesulfobacteriota bacterium]|nr:outer membrane lipoprotein carrier protein LolA [Thermodesulfobacteriota bacterium]
MKTTMLEWKRSFPLFYSLCAGSSLIWLTMFSCGVSMASDGLSISEILERVQKRYAVTDFEADFVQESHLKAMDMVDSASGHVCFRPPAMMRWHYETPEQYLIMTDGDSVWIYRPEENQVMVGRTADYFGDATWTGFFAEPDKLLDEFVVHLAAKEFTQEGQFVLELLPKKSASNLAKILLFISESTFDIVRSVTYNLFGDKTSIRFEAFRFNQNLDTSLFVFKVPKDADVLQLEGEGN